MKIFRIICLNNVMYAINIAIRGKAGTNYNQSLNMIDNLPHDYPEFSHEHKTCFKVIASSDSAFGLPLLPSIEKNEELIARGKQLGVSESAMEFFIAGWIPIGVELDESNNFVRYIYEEKNKTKTLMPEKKIREEFEELAKKFDSRTGGMSVTRQAMGTDEAKKIIELGETVLPLIIDRIRENKGFYWIEIVRQITNCDFIPKHHAGNADLMEADTIEWYDNIYLKGF